MKIEVLGTGCPKCKKTYEIAREAVKEAGRSDVEVVKVEDINEITSRGVMITPAVMVDGEVKCAGKLPTREDVKGWL